MSRLYIIALFFGPLLSNAQIDLKKTIAFAGEQMKKGDLISALDNYEKAMRVDSNTVALLWDYALANEAYKDYEKAAYYFRKVYNKENAIIYPESILKLGLMLKQCGKYDEALVVFKQAKKTYKKKKEYNYIKANKEFESTLWAKSHLVDSIKQTIISLPETVNSKNSEFGHGVYNNALYFSSLRADSISTSEEVFTTTYKTKLYTSKITADKFEENEVLKQLAYEKFNSGNGTFSLNKKQFYFSLCSEKAYNYTCKILVAFVNNGKLSAIDTLSELVNEKQANTTMPHIANLEGQEVLFFSSDRESSNGKMDIYYCEIKNGQQFTKAIPVKVINSIDSEITPYYDDATKRLYFASNWHNGFGGFDVHYVTFRNNNFENITNVGKPINSQANDLYFFKDRDSSYVSSNRIGVLYSKNPTCCSDIFMMYEEPEIKINDTTSIVVIKETLDELNKRLPVTLYFHNDEPNPKNTETFTKLSYSETYNSYNSLLDKYRKEYSKGLNTEKATEATEDIESFFLEYVNQGFSNLKLFTELLLIELTKGQKIKITVKGFASPLAKTDYNVNLTKRRISSMVNELSQMNNGIFLEYLNGTAKNGGKIEIEEIAFGEYKANQLISDNPNDVQNSVYSRAAALERKIEILSVSIIK